MCEIWKDVEDYKGLYQVSNLGRVRSVDRVVVYSDGIPHLHKSRILKFYEVRGYSYVTLSKDNKSSHYRVHRLVAEAFVPNINNLSEINHINEDKSDNRASNLEWCDSWYNMHYGKMQFNNVGRELSDDTRRRISKSLKGHKVSTDTRHKISVANKQYYNKLREEKE